MFFNKETYKTFVRKQTNEMKLYAMPGLTAGGGKPRRVHSGGDWPRDGYATCQRASTSTTWTRAFCLVHCEMRKRRVAVATRADVTITMGATLSCAPENGGQRHGTRGARFTSTIN